ncbi:MAG: RDD family protein [Bacteroidetes bacterium]|nr:RDD family protein [Bacteroidota bacterium]
MEEQEQTQSQPQSTEQTVEQPQYAGFWIRFVAIIIDSLVLGFVSFVVVLPLLGVLGMTASDMGDFSEMEETAILGFLAGVGISLYVSNFIITWLYYALMQSGKWQATLGKKAVGIKVTGVVV